MVWLLFGVGAALAKGNREEHNHPEKTAGVQQNRGLLSNPCEYHKRESTWMCEIVFVFCSQPLFQLWGWFAAWASKGDSVSFGASQGPVGSRYRRQGFLCLRCWSGGAPRARRQRGDEGSGCKFDVLFFCFPHFFPFRGNPLFW